MQIDDLFSQLGTTQSNLLPYDGELYNYGFALSKQQADNYFTQLLTQIDWQADTALIYNKLHRTERKIAWYGDKAFVYHYSGTNKVAQPWLAVVHELKKQVEQHLQQRFNSCLVNLYHNGQEGMGWHSDDEQTLGITTSIASLSLGSTRRFCFKHKTTKHKCELSLQHGQLVVMQGVTQRFWWHCIPKMADIHQPRINLTFRTIIPAQ